MNKLANSEINKFLKDFNDAKKMKTYYPDDARAKIGESKKHGHGVFNTSKIKVGQTIAWYTAKLVSKQVIDDNPRDYTEKYLLSTQILQDALQKVFESDEKYNKKITSRNFYQKLYDDLSNDEKFYLYPCPLPNVRSKDEDCKKLNGVKIANIGRFFNSTTAIEKRDVDLALTDQVINIFSRLLDSAYIGELKKPNLKNYKFIFGLISRKQIKCCRELLWHYENFDDDDTDKKNNKRRKKS